MSGSQWLSLPRAVAASGVDACVALHYGQPFTEQRDLLAGGLVDFSHRGVLALTGPDRLTWLDSITSQELLTMRPGESRQALILDPNGRIEYVLELLDDGETLWVIAEAGSTEPLLAWLIRMRFRARIEIADRSEDFAVLGSLGDPGVPLPVATENGVPLIWLDGWSRVAPGGFSYAGDQGHPGHSWNWRETLVPRSALAEIAALPDFKPVGLMAWDALRVAAWRPRVAIDGDDRTLPHELDLLRVAVHLNKGCYRGQETVAKVHNLGHPPRRLVMLQMDGSLSELPAVGDKLFITTEPDRPVGLLRSVANHYEDGPIAFALLKRSVPVDAGLGVLVSGQVMTCAQEIIVPPEAGATANITLRRRRL